MPVATHSAHPPPPVVRKVPPNPENGSRLQEADTMAEKVPAKGNVFGKILPSRYVLAVLGSIGLAIIYGLKVNLSVAMVGMLNHTALAAAHEVAPIEHSQIHVETPPVAIAGDECTEGNSTDVVEDGPFTWSEPLQGAMLSSYFWGYIVAQVPGGRVAELVSAKWVMFFSVFINVICTLLTPVTAKLHYGAMLSMRILEGVGGGVTFPAMHVMLASWAPPAERSVMSSIVYAGTALGTVISMLLAGVLAGNLGWESVFYVMGGASIIWLLAWAWLVADTPDKQSLISEEERSFIVSALQAEGGGGHKGKKPPVPWKKVLTSMPFIAILVAHTCSNWGWYMVLIELPFYMKQVLKFKITENAVLTAVPFLCMWIFSMILSKTLDTLRGKNIISTTFARKTGTLFASFVPMCCLIALCYIGCMRSLAVFLMTIAVMCIGGMFCGFLSNHIDIAPNYAGTLMALTNTAATLPGIIVPVFVGKLTHGNQTIDAWRVIFWTTAALYVIEIIVYTTFGSGEEQPWNRCESTPEAVEAQPLRSTPNQNNQEQPGYDSTNNLNDRNNSDATIEANLSTEDATSSGVETFRASSY